ncbi:hypothetical protein BJY59DRAFT_686733 [Rhodotorula toruloides]
MYGVCDCSSTRRRVHSRPKSRMARSRLSTSPSFFAGCLACRSCGLHTSVTISFGSSLKGDSRVSSVLRFFPSLRSRYFRLSSKPGPPSSNACRLSITWTSSIRRRESCFLQLARTRTSRFSSLPTTTLISGRRTTSALSSQVCELST